MTGGILATPTPGITPKIAEEEGLVLESAILAQKILKGDISIQIYISETKDFQVGGKKVRDRTYYQMRSGSKIQSEFGNMARKSFNDDLDEVNFRSHTIGDPIIEGKINYFSVKDFLSLDNSIKDIDSNYKIMDGYAMKSFGSKLKFYAVVIESDDGKCIFFKKYGSKTYMSKLLGVFKNGKVNKLSPGEEIIVFEDNFDFMVCSGTAFVFRRNGFESIFSEELKTELKGKIKPILDEIESYEYPKFKIKNFKEFKDNINGRKAGMDKLRRAYDGGFFEKVSMEQIERENEILAIENRVKIIKDSEGKSSIEYEPKKANTLFKLIFKHMFQDRMGNWLAAEVTSPA